PPAFHRPSPSSSPAPAGRLPRPSLPPADRRASPDANAPDPASAGGRSAACCRPCTRQRRSAAHSPPEDPGTRCRPYAAAARKRPPCVARRLSPAGWRLPSLLSLVRPPDPPIEVRLPAIDQHPQIPAQLRITHVQLAAHPGLGDAVAVADDLQHLVPAARCRVDALGLRQGLGGRLLDHEAEYVHSHCPHSPSLPAFICAQVSCRSRSADALPRCFSTPANCARTASAPCSRYRRIMLRTSHRWRSRSHSSGDSS